MKFALTHLKRVVYEKIDKLSWFFGEDKFNNKAFIEIKLLQFTQLN